MGLIFRSALPEELDEEYRAEDVALSPDAIMRCLVNMLTALDRDTPQISHEPATHNLEIQGATTIQEPPWLWFTLPELGFPLLTDEYRRPIHPDIEDYMRDVSPTTKTGNKSTTKTVGGSTTQAPQQGSKEKSKPLSTAGAEQ